MSRNDLHRCVGIVVGTLLVAVQASRAPLDAAFIALAFAVTWWVRQRLVRPAVERRRHLRHVRRHVATVALVTAGLWTGLVIVRMLGQTSDTTARVVDDPDPQAVAVDADRDPWPGWVYLIGLGTTLGLAMTSGGILTLRSARRERRRREHSASAAAAAIPR